MAVPALEPYVRRFAELFGFRPASRWRDERNGYDGVVLEIPGSSDVDWEVLAPYRKDCHLHRFLESSLGPGLHHVAFEVRDLRAAADELRAAGIEPWTPGAAGQDAAGNDGDGDDGDHDELFIHPRRGGHGFLFQLYAAGVPSWRPEGSAAEPPPDAEPARDAPPVPAHTLGIKAINHLSHAHPDRAALSAWYEDVLGMGTCYRSPDGEHAPFSTQVLETPTGQMRWEVLQPGAPASFVQRFLEARGPAMHHVAFEVWDWACALDACAHHGVPTFGQREGETGGARWHEAFIHPRHSGGVLAQIFWQERPGVWI